MSGSRQLPCSRAAPPRKAVEPTQHGALVEEAITDEVREGRVGAFELREFLLESGELVSMRSPVGVRALARPTDRLEDG